MARILIAEDNMAVQNFVARALTHRGHEVAAVGDGVQALESLTDKSYDLLITDIVMPGLDGIGLALKVARDYPQLPVLLMSGYSAERQRAHNLEELICKVVSKRDLRRRRTGPGRGRFRRPSRRLITGCLTAGSGSRTAAAGGRCSRARRAAAGARRVDGAVP
jgi:CheY-like chemotaxis protein